MRKLIFAIILVFGISACSVSEERVHENNVDEEKNEINNEQLFFNQLEEYLTIGLEKPTEENILIYINDIQYTFEFAQQEIIEKNIGKYVVFKVKRNDNTAICLWEKGKKSGEIIANDRNSAIDGFIKRTYLIIDIGTNYKTIYNLALSNTNENFKSEIKVFNKIYDIKNTDWVAYLSPSSNSTVHIPRDEAMDIKFYNLATKEDVVYKEANNNYEWALELNQHGGLEIIRVDWNENSNQNRVVLETQNLEKWIGDFKASSIIYSLDEIENYLSKEIEKPTEENIKSYIMQLPDFVENSVVKIMNEYENDKYFVFQVSEEMVGGVDSEITCAWEKGKSNGGFVIDKWNSGIEGWLTDKYLVIDSGSWTIRGKTVCNMTLDVSNENFYDYFSVYDPILNFEGTDWIIFASLTDNQINNMEIDELCNIELYNLKTNERIIYREAKDNYAWFLGNRRTEDGLIDLIIIEGNEEMKIKSTVIGKIDLTNWSKIASEINLAIPQKYIDFLKDKDDYDKNDSFLFYANEDIDLDGNNEVIIATGISNEDPISSYVSQLYILRDNNGEIVQLGENLANQGYSVYELVLVQLQNKPKGYIYSGLTNGGGLTGFNLIELTNNQPKIVTYSASATGAGNDEIMDFDNDGKMDGYIQNRWSYDVLYYPLTRIYTLTNNGFELSETEIELPNYSMNIEGVILQYISLRTLNIEKSSEVDKRLSELCMDEKGNELDFSSEIWHSAILNTIIDFENKITFIIDENEDTAEVTIKFFDENDDNKEYERKFHLIKTDNSWRIDQIIEKTS